MDPKLLKHFLSIQPLSNEEVEAIDETMHIQEFKKGTLLLKEGDISSSVYFVLEGIVRQFYTLQGEEKTSDFFTEEQWVLSATNVNPNLPSTCYLECCTDCKLLIGNSEKGEYLYKKFPNLETVSRKLMNKVFMDQQAKMEAFLVATPKLRYLNLLKTNRELFQRIPQYYIASYIGVTPESLSRIRKRLAQEI